MANKDVAGPNMLPLSSSQNFAAWISCCCNFLAQLSSLSWTSQRMKTSWVMFSKKVAEAEFPGQAGGWWYQQELVQDRSLYHVVKNSSVSLELIFQNCPSHKEPIFASDFDQLFLKTYFEFLKSVKSIL